MTRFGWRASGIKLPLPLQWRYNGLDGVSNHQPHDCLLNCLLMCRSKKTSKLRVTGLCAENSPVTGEFPAQMARNAENVSIWWRHHAMTVFGSCMRCAKCLNIFNCCNTIDLCHTVLYKAIGPLRWRHNGHDSVSNHQPHDCLLNLLSRRRSKNTSKLRVTGLCAGNSPGNSLHKGPVTRKMFPFDDVIMHNNFTTNVKGKRFPHLGPLWGESATH